MTDMDRCREYFRKSSFLALAAALLISSCGGSGGSGDSPSAAPSLNVSPASVEADAGGGEVSVDVTVSGEGSLRWNASVPAGVGWARIAGGGTGTGAGSISIAVDANTGAAREFELSVSAGSAVSRNVTISQAEAPQMIDVSADSTVLDGEGGSVTLQVRNTGSGTLNWSARLPEGLDWAYIESGESGTDAGEIVVQYGINGGADRELEVTVTATSASNSPQSLSLGQEWFGASACTYPEARQEVLDWMEDLYYFNDEAEQAARYGEIVLEDHENIDSMLDELRWMPETHDRGFTYWLTRKQSDELFNAEASIFGFRLTYIVDANENPLHLEVLDVYGGSPAADAGLERGDRIHSLNGKAISGLSIGEIGIEFGPSTEGHTVTFETEKLSGERRTFDMAKARIEIPTVPDEHAKVWDSDAGQVGYLHFRTFFGDAPGRLLEEFAEFKSKGVRNLIVDLRYNGGGSVPIAHGLATLIGGPELFESGRRTVMAQQIHNQRNAGRDETTYFGCGVYGSPALVAKCERESSLRDLDNVVFITGRGSASASELVITALQPYENVALVGERTYGKPVGQYGLAFCPPDFGSGLGLLWPVSFASVNADGFEDYYDGIAVECEVPDDRASQLGEREEGRIAAALNYIETGSCDTPGSARAAREQEAMQMTAPLDPVREFLGH